MRKSFFVSLLFVLLAVCGFGKGEYPPRTGSITGRVWFKGVPPVMGLLPMSKEPFCAAERKKHPQREETIVVNPDHTLKYAVVFIKSGLRRKKFPVNPPRVLDQYGCWFRPHVLAVTVGQTIKCINDDPAVLHNFHFMSKRNPPLNFSEAGEPSGGKFISIPVVFYRPEMIPLMCDIHPWMQAVIAVLPNPYFQVTGNDGSFIIGGLPPGRYVLEAWHEGLGRKIIRVTVRAGRRQIVNFVFSRRRRHPHRRKFKGRGG